VPIDDLGNFIDQRASHGLLLRFVPLDAFDGVAQDMPY
jgi:hypothetical protein